MLLMRFIYDSKQKFPVNLERFSVEVNGKVDESLLAEAEMLFCSYESYREQVRNGSLGKIAQFWILYLVMMRMQHVIHTAVQENDFDARFAAWKYFIPLYFAFNKTNYARYGSFYVETLQSIEEKYPGLKEMLKKAGLSVQGQDKYLLRIAIDQRGEQTINHDAKTSGGIKAFSTNNESVTKWCLNRSEQTKNTKALYDLYGLDAGSNTYKLCRPSQILKTEELVQAVMNTLMNEYINPFDVLLEKDELISLSSSVPLNSEATEFLLSSYAMGKERRDEFVKTQISESFHRCKISTFKVMVKKTTTSNNKSIEVNRDILGRLLSVSLKESKTIDFVKALHYPLCEVPLRWYNEED